MEEYYLRKIMMLLFTICFIFTTQTVYADAGSSSSGLTIPVEFIAIPLIIISLIAFGLLAKNYSRYRDRLAQDHYIEPVSTSKITPQVEAPVISVLSQNDADDREVSDHDDNIEKTETPKTNTETIHTQSTNKTDNLTKPQDDPLPKEYKILQVFAYILIIAGLIMKFIAKRKKK